MSADTDASAPTRARPRHRALYGFTAAAVRGHRLSFAAATAGGMVNVAAMMLTPLVTQAAIDTATVAHRPDRLPALLPAFAVLGAVRAAGGALRRYHSLTFAYRAGARIRGNVFRHAVHLDSAFHDETGAGELMSRLASDVTIVETFFTLLPFLVQGGALLLAGLVVLPVLQPVVGGVALAAMALAASAPLRWTARLSHHAHRNQESAARFTAFVEEQIGGVRVIKGHGLENTHQAAGAGLATRLREAATGLGRAAAQFSAGMSALPGVALLVAVALGGWMATSGALTPGRLFAFVQYEMLLLAPVQIASQLLVHGSFATASADRLAEILATEPTIGEPLRPRLVEATGPPALAFVGVSASYLERKPVLRDVSFVVPPGCSMGVVGATGCGKTTLLRLVLRLRDPDAGGVRLNGVDVRELSLLSLRAGIAAMVDDALVFSGTVRDNVGLGHAGAGDAEIWAALTAAGAAGFATRLPAGLETELGERGVALSGGQRQRLALARTLLRPAPLVLLDDPTTALDPDTTVAVHDALLERVRGRTTVMVSHHPELLARLDAVVLMHRGHVVATGPHAELLGLAAYRDALALEAA